MACGRSFFLSVSYLLGLGGGGGGGGGRLLGL